MKKRNKNILFILPSMKNAGPVNVCLTIINNLPSDYNITLLSLGEGERRAEFEKKCNVVVFKKTSLFKILNFLYKNHFDIIHSHCTISDIYNFLCFKKTKKITTIHNYFDVDFVQTKGLIKGRLEGVVGRYVIKDFIKVACSNAVKDYCTERFSLKGMIAIPNGVNVPVFSNFDIEHKNDDSVNFYYLGVINKRKNVEVILDAFTEWSVGKNAKLNIIGGGVDEVVLKNKYNNEKIFFHGMIQNPHELFVNFDCFVSASKAEGLPLALIESLSLGKAFICSDIEPHKEVYNNTTGICGYLFNGTRKGLIKCYDAYYQTQDKGKLETYAINTYLKYYTGAIMGQKYDDVYNLCLK
ncbi:TPA: glycosyltransferase family 4 protein [Escherichia coli]|nr:glycosyltransferase family 4 protein [Escherichia coli]